MWRVEGGGRREDWVLPLLQAAYRLFETWKKNTFVFYIFLKN